MGSIFMSLSLHFTSSSGGVRTESERKVLGSLCNFLDFHVFDYLYGQDFIRVPLSLIRRRFEDVGHGRVEGRTTRPTPLERLWV